MVANSSTHRQKIFTIQQHVWVTGTVIVYQMIFAQISKELVKNLLKSTRFISLCYIADSNRKSKKNKNIFFQVIKIAYTVKLRYLLKIRWDCLNISRYLSIRDIEDKIPFKKVVGTNKF